MSVQDAVKQGDSGFESARAVCKPLLVDYPDPCEGHWTIDMDPVLCDKVPAVVKVRQLLSKASSDVVAAVFDAMVDPRGPANLHLALRVLPENLHPAACAAFLRAQSALPAAQRGVQLDSYQLHA